MVVLLLLSLWRIFFLIEDFIPEMCLWGSVEYLRPRGEFQGCVPGRARKLWPPFMGGERVQSDTENGCGGVPLATVSGGRGSWSWLVCS